MNPTRSCILCRKRNNKDKLFRIVSKNFEAYLDNTQKINSRGIYICKDINCINKCLKKINNNKLTLKINIDKKSLVCVLENLKKELEEM